MSLPKSSLAKLDGVHPDLARVILKAAETGPAFIVTCGKRSKAEQAAKYAQGRTAPGPIVTWTLKSKHVPGDDGLSHAVDVAPIINGAIPWNDAAAFAALAARILSAAKALGVVVVWGKDWNRNGKPGEKGETDGPHFQLAA